MKSEIVINDLRKQIEEETVQICEEFRQYLDSPKTKMSIVKYKVLMIRYGEQKIKIKQ
jgi:hypothetical protein